MKIIGRKYMLVIFFFIYLLIVINLIEGSIDINQSNINECIEQYFNSKNEDGKVKVVSYRELGTDKYGTVINQYSLVRTDVYDYADGNLEYNSTIIYPARFKIISFLGFKNVILCSSPPDGESYGKTLRKLLPKDIFNMLDENYNEYSENLERENKEKFSEINN
jgi:hypothetical protein